jgi:NAD+ kinase
MRLGVVGNPRYEEIRALLSRLVGWAEDLDLKIHPEIGLAEYCPGSEVPLDSPDIGDELDLLLTFGGDGTLLRGARLLGRRDVPILGVDLGRVGFLNSAPPDGLRAALEDFKAGKFEEERRRTIEVAVYDAEGVEQERGRALNDVVVHKVGVARVIQLLASIDDVPIGQYSADGIIVATPTGSTAYSLSAGGPLVMPGVDAMVITAIAPHTLAVRPIVVPGDREIHLKTMRPYSDDVLTSFDGQVGTTLEPGGWVSIRQDEQPIRLIRMGTEGFFQRVRRKLQWGDLSDRENV